MIRKIEFRIKDSFYEVEVNLLNYGWRYAGDRRKVAGENVDFVIGDYADNEKIEVIYEGNSLTIPYKYTV